MPPQRLLVKSQYANIHGGYFLVDSQDGELLPIYRRDKDNSEDAKQAWIFNAGTTAGKRWYISDAPRSDSQFKYLAESLNDAQSPDLVDWPTDKVEAVKEPRPTGDLIKREASKLFVDNDFPHTQTSLGVDNLKAEWVPARCLWEGNGNLFDGIEPRDLLQGGLGDCWFVAALACLAEFPDKVKQLFTQPTTNKLDVLGKYTVQLFDNNLARRSVTVDEFIPCKPLRWWDDQAMPIFSKPHGNEAWVLLLEKAMAKLMGSYGALNGGDPGVAFRAFTGESNTFMWKRENGVWNKSILAKGSTGYISDEGSAAHASSEDLFLSLAMYDRSSYLMSAAISNKSGGETKRADGLVEGHAYSVLQVVEADGHHLLSLRNPWGNDHEWKHAWSDKDSMWDRFPKVKERLQPNFGADGLFWMSWDDFQTRFNAIRVCACQMRDKADTEAHSKASQDGQKSPVLSSDPRIKRKPINKIPVLVSGHHDSHAPRPPHLPNGYPHSDFHQVAPGHRDSHAPPPPTFPSGHPHSLIMPGHHDNHAPPPPGQGLFPNGHPHSSMPVIAQGHHDSDAPLPPSPAHLPSGHPHSNGAFRPSYRPSWTHVFPGDYVDPNEPPPPEPPKPRPPSHLDLPPNEEIYPSGWYNVRPPHVDTGRYNSPGHSKSHRRRKTDSPPTPPPPQMPFAVTPSPAYSSPLQPAMWSRSPWTGLPVFWNPAAYSSQPALQHLMPPDSPVKSALPYGYNSLAPFGSPSRTEQSFNSERQHIKADIESLSHRIHSLVHTSDGNTTQRARLLVNELGNIESFCSDLGDEWSAIQNMLENLRSELTGRRDYKLDRGSNTASIQAPRVQTFSTTVPSGRQSSSAVPVGKRFDDPVPPNAREAFRTRMTNLMRLYGAGDDACDSIFREMDSSFPHGAPQPEDKHVNRRGTWPPPPERLPADYSRPPPPERLPADYSRHP